MRNGFAVVAATVGALGAFGWSSVLTTMARTIYVDLDAIGASDGSSWRDAFTDLQDALAAAGAGDEVWVAEGRYVPGPVGNTDATFTLLSGVGLYGGFVGDETQRTQRDWDAHRTLLSGDLGGDDVYGNPWYNGWNINTPNAKHVVTGSGVDASAVLDGFNVIAGYVTTGSGGGMYNQGGSPTITHCTFMRNLAGFSSGGAMLNWDSSPTIRDTTFVENYVHLGQGAGMYNTGASAPLIERCVFRDNRCVGSASGGEGAGGGLSHYSSLPMTIRETRFDRNVSVSFYPSGDYGGTYAGAIHHFSGGMTVERCWFIDNFSNAGGAIWSWVDMTIVNSLFYSNDAPEYHAGQGGWGGIGGAIGASSFRGAIITVVGCTIVGNTAEAGGGLRVLQSADCDVAGCIFWDNRGRFGTIGPAQIRGCGARYSCIQNMLVGEPGEDPPDPADFPECFDDDPLFVAAYTDLHLAAGSPCIDAADNTAYPGWAVKDLDGAVRFIDDPQTPDRGNGTPPVADMGAFELDPNPGGCTRNPEWVCDGDVNGNGAVNPVDVGLVQAAFCAAGECPEEDLCQYDLDCNGVINPVDAGLVQSLFGACDPPRSPCD
jgi:hypothetical protein